MQGVLALLFLAVVVLELHGDAGERDVLLLCVELEGQGLAGPQGGIEIIVGFGGSAFATGGHKGLLGPVGQGFLWTDPTFRHLLSPSGTWLSVLSWREARVCLSARPSRSF